MALVMEYGDITGLKQTWEIGSISMKTRPHVGNEADIFTTDEE